MIEAETKLALLRYNLLSKERAVAAYMWGHAGESVCDEAKWSKCVDEMSKMRDELWSRGYKFDSTGYKKVGKAQYEVYKIVPVSNA